MSANKAIEQVLKNGLIGKLSKLFSDADHSLFLVGGSVRDVFINRAHEDFDLTTDALPEEIEEIVKDFSDEIWTVGKKYGTIGFSKNSKKAEITTFRSEIYEPESRHPKVTYSKTIEEDLKRRDFTVNAIAISLPDGKVIDPHNGINDLNDLILKTPQASEKSFTDDPLRMLRALRFSAMLGFKIDPDTLKAIGDLKERLAIISKERIQDELSKLLLGDFAPGALRLMVEIDISEYVVPELSSLKMTRDDEHHHKDVLEHTFKVVYNTEPDLILRLTALLHDIGKPSTKTIEKGNVHFYGHDVVGARMARKRLRELRYPKDIIEKVSKLIRLHLRPYNYAMGWTDSAVKRYARDAGELLSRLNKLAIADCTTRFPEKAQRNLELIKDLENRIDKLNEEEEIAKILPPIDGNEIM
ncbi:MAG: CCA tRNA nucleotidyltransferase, partial [Actinobacteria bacterium]